MLTDDIKNEYYQALLDKNTHYEGVFYVGVKTTGVFCRPTCAARKPKFENCEFYQTAQEAFLAQLPMQMARISSPSLSHVTESLIVMVLWVGMVVGLHVSNG